MDYQDGTGQYIWLRYATQYSKDDRTHTIEMGIPMPIGASAETREKLLREAEIGMSQLVRHVEERVFQALERVQSGPATSDPGATIPLPQILPLSATSTSVGAGPRARSESQAMPAVPDQPSPAQTRPVNATSVGVGLRAQPESQATPAVPDQPPPAQTRPAHKPAAISAPQTTPQVPNAQRTPPRIAPPPAQAVEVPPTRDSVGASMPTSLGPTITGGNLTISEFVNYVDKNLHLKPKQAMDLLRVKTLTGINLREALEKLKQIVAQNAQSGASSPQQQASMVRETRPVVSAPVSRNTPSSPPAQVTVSMHRDATISESPPKPPEEASGDPEEERTLNVIELRVPPPASPAPPPAQPARGFDEEEELEDLDDSDNSSVVSEISSEQLGRARDKISALRQMQGATVTSEARLRALRNAADDEVSDGQLQDLVLGVWNIATLKKLKKDQVEALISWAKEDDFLSEIKAVLFVLEEERYARGNR
jgi:hypothetical protein